MGQRLCKNSNCVRGVISPGLSQTHALYAPVLALQALYRNPLRSEMGSAFFCGDFLSHVRWLLFSWVLILSSGKRKVSHNRMVDDDNTP
mmetsp:Transcript_18727/g.36706  ORF Transcript_18727/g.36706 Transcript_18727/m.36706 type:complete len:89 (+) Transcript_18727:84-350(+)